MRAPIVIAAGLALVAAAGAAFVFSGAYNIAASQPHYAIVWWLLDMVKERSVKRHAGARPPRNLDDASLAFRGAGPYQESCAPCHGPPGNALGALGEGLNPKPPDPRESAKRWSAPELFWIAKHGVKYTGMPAWNWLYRDDEIWSLVSLMRRFPSMTGEEYRAWTNPPAAQSAARTDAADLAAHSCAMCHGADGRGRGEVPSLAGQRREFIADSLRRYASGERRSGIMALPARRLRDPEIDALADYYAGLYSPTPTSIPGSAEAARLQLGGAIAAAGAAGVQACAACHDGSSTRGHSLVPRLAGQQRAYLTLQLDLWRSGVRTDSPMREIAAKLTPAQIEALAAYYANLP
jgi:cytochrome c553